ncbi:hypothetical protein GCM10027614_11710 [Micromonospora vulcania]
MAAAEACHLKSVGPPRAGIHYRIEKESNSMRRSTRARRSSGNARSKRLLAVVGTLAVFGGVVAVTQISSAQDRRTNKPRPAAGQCGAEPGRDRAEWRRIDHPDLAERSVGAQPLG